MYSYLLINGYDFSMYVSGLKVSRAANYSAQTNAAGNTVVDYINTKRTIEATIIPINSEMMMWLLSLINNMNVVLTIREPATGELADVNVMIPDNEIEYYTIQAEKILFKPLTLTFIEL